MTEKREKEIKIRVNSDELKELKNRSTRHELARWMRETCLGQKSGKYIGTEKKADPELLRQLAGIGNNLNQIARKINSSDKEAVEKMQIIFLLASIEERLTDIKN